MKKILSLLVLFYFNPGFSQNTTVQEDNNIYNLAGINVKPQFPGGIKNLNALVNESYLKSGFAAEVKGKVYALFIIEKDGSMSDVKILRGIDAVKARELIRILENLPKWTPGKQNGKIVRVLYNLQMEIGN